MSINRVLITGNLTRDPELRSTGSGMAVLKMGVAVNDRRKNPQSGEWEDVPNFIDVVMFGSRGESVSRFLSKGSKVAIEGKLRWSSWEDKESGAKRSKVEVVADDIEFLSSRNDSSGGGGSYSPPAAAAPASSSADPVFEDDIPF
jgi:single-strand DNA-binding protein